MVRLLTTLRTGETHFAHFFCLLSRSFIFFVDRAEEFDRQLVHAVESVMIEWTHQVRDVLKKDSSQPLLDGENPTPFVEVEFWKAKALNLECVYDQVSRRQDRKYSRKTPDAAIFVLAALTHSLLVLELPPVAHANVCFESEALIRIIGNSDMRVLFMCAWRLSIAL